MPPRTRTNKLTKASKENNDVLLRKAAEKTGIRSVKEKRKPLADKTNSASDENDSKLNNKDTMRPRRDRRLPSRFIDNNLLVNLSSSFSHSTPVKSVSRREKPTNQLTKQITPKTDVSKTDSDKNNNPGKEKRIPKSAKNIKTSVSNIRGKSIISRKLTNKDVIISGSKTSRMDEISLMSKTEEKGNIHLGSKIKGKNIVLPVRKLRTKGEITQETKAKDEISSMPKTREKNITKPASKKHRKEVVIHVEKPKDKSPFGSKTRRISESKNMVKNFTTPVKHLGTQSKTTNYNKDFSYRILEDKEIPKKDEEKLAVYDFTFDPAEEPPPQKKKKKKIVRKKGPPKQKKFIYDNYYDHNISKALEALKDVVNQKSANNAIKNSIPVKTTAQTVPVMNKSPRQTEVAHFSEINYSPCSSLNDIDTRKTSEISVEKLTPKSMTNSTKLVNKNLINIQDEISFFDDQPIANSSMNESVRNPNASPWRVEFTALPIKWGVNSYVKANMTPAVESSYINPEDTGKKHIYTNILFNDLDKVNTSDNLKLKQTSITTFMKDANEKVGQNKNKILTPTKDNSVFDDSRSDVSNLEHRPEDICVPECDSLKENEDNKNNTPLKRKNEEVLDVVPAKTRKEVVATAENFFGFDESTIHDQENISPDNNAVIVRKPKLRKKVLQESNQLVGPMRANLPRFVKEKILDVEVPLTIPSDHNVITESNLVDPVAESDSEEEENSKSDENDVGLFEDIEVFHHNKPIRKSYGKPKKVTFCQPTTMDPHDINTTGDSDLVDDTSFHVPVVHVRKPAKKKTKVQKRSKKEEKEAEEWAAGFNSMCEDVDNFDLVVE